MSETRTRKLADLRSEFMERLRRCSEDAWRRLQETHPDASGPARRSDGTNDSEDINEGVILSDLHRCNAECRRLVVAIRRIDRGEYGVCATCGEEVAERRLRAVPATANCLDCQEQFERQSSSAPASMRL